jgi:F-type H+-transporting ATPase subunit delta
MKNQVLIKKYARGFIEAMDNEAEFKASSAELRVFAGLLSSDEKLRQVLIAPFLKMGKRAEIMKDILQSAAIGEKASRFLSLLLEHKRLGLIEDIIAGLDEIWNDMAGISTFTVTSAVPMSEKQRKELAENLERREKGPVWINYAVDPEVIGGLSLRRGHIIYDASVAGNLLRLKQLIQQG